MDSLKSRKEWKRHKVKDGHNVFRILPPFGEASNGYPYRKWQIIWGLTDPESGRARPFASSLTSEKRCPVNEFVQLLKQRAETMTGKLEALDTPKEEIKNRMKGLQELIGNIIPKTVYVYNAADRSGEVGLLELKSTAHKDMKEKMNKYIQDYNQDPTSLGSADDDSGVWFDIIRSNATGQFRDTKYDVEKVQTRLKEASGKVSFVDDRSPLSDAVVENYDNLAYDLSAIYQTKTYDELNEVLQANLPSIIEAYPDADLSIEPNLANAYAAPVATAATPRAQAAPAAKPTGTSRVTTRLDDEDDDIDETKLAAPASSANVRGTTTRNLQAAATASSAITDDFMAEADRLLRS